MELRHHTTNHAVISRAVLSVVAADHTLTMRGATRFEQGATFSGAGTLVNHSAGTMILEHGSNVNVDVLNNGRLEVGDDVGEATIKRLHQAAIGTLAFSIAGTTAGTQYSQLVSASNVAIQGGTLELSPQDLSYQDPEVAGTVDEFLLITSNFLSGEFDTTTYDDMQLDWEYTTADTYRSHEGEGLFRILEYGGDEVHFLNYRALAGDANGDGTVDGLDFILWNDHKFTSGTDWTSGDFNGDGLTDGLDFILWNDNKFASVGNFDVVSVPEPSAALLLFLGLAPLGVRFRRS